MLLKQGSQTRRRNSQPHGTFWNEFETPVLKCLDSNITVIHQSKHSANFSLGTLESGQTALKMHIMKTESHTEKTRGTSEDQDYCLSLSNCVNHKSKNLEETVNDRLHMFLPDSWAAGKVGIKLYGQVMDWLNKPLSYSRTGYRITFYHILKAQCQ